MQVKTSAPRQADSGPRCGTAHNTRNWVNLEPCGLFCGLVTWWLLAYGMYATTTCVIAPWLGFGIWGSLHAGLFNILSLVAIYSHFAAMTTDPGAVPRDCAPLPDDAEENDYEIAKGKGERYRKFCKRCRAFKPLRAHHCSVCGRCIVKMDHHCPWVNNCVGIGNHKLFLLFLLWVNVVCGYALVLSISKYSFCRGDGCGTPMQNLLNIFLVVEASLFGLFTVCMMGDQSSVLTTNLTKIDILKGSKAPADTGVEGFNEVFGCSGDVSFRSDWLVPRRAVFPESLRDRILGYCHETHTSLLDGHGQSSHLSQLSPLSPHAGTGQGQGQGQGQQQLQASSGANANDGASNAVMGTGSGSGSGSGSSSGGGGSAVTERPFEGIEMKGVGGLQTGHHGHDNGSQHQHQHQHQHEQSSQISSSTYDGEDNDMSRTRLGSAEIWGLSEAIISTVSEGGRGRGGDGGYRDGYSVRRRSGPPF